MSAPRRLAALLLLLSALLALGGCAGGAAASEAGPGAPETAALPFPTQVPRPGPGIEELPLYCEGLLCGRAYARGGEVYLPVAGLCRLFGLELDEDVREDGFALRLPGVTVTGETGAEVLRADARYLYAPGGCLTVQGRLCLPLETAAHLFGAALSAEQSPARVELESRQYRLLSGEGDYYTLHYSVEDLYWLSHIIHAEAGTEPLAGRIGVGSVVLNRVRSENYPDSIMQVVIQRDASAAQFEPAANGSVRFDADEDSLIAAYLCLEGYNTVGESLYFVNPDAADNRWFEQSRSFTVRIGVHDFYT